MDHRWVRPTFPAVAGLTLAATLVAAAADATTGLPPACPGGGSPPGAVAPSPDRPPAWFDLQPILDEGGALVGQRLTVIGPTGTERSLALPPESSASGPDRDRVLVVADDGARSRVTILDLRRDCLVPVAEASAVIRRAALDPSGRILVETRVDRATRADLGVWRRSLEDPTRASRILPPPEPDDRYGPTWTTGLAWSPDGSALAVQSCGAIACRTRVVEDDTPTVEAIEGPDQGPMVGLADGYLVTHAACRGLPCPLRSTRLADGRTTLLEPIAGAAAIETDPGTGVRVVVETLADGAALRLRSLAPDGRGARDLGPVPTGWRLAVGPPGSDRAGRLPGGWIALAPDGPGSGRDSLSTRLRRATAAPPVRLPEVTR